MARCKQCRRTVRCVEVIREGDTHTSWITVDPKTRMKHVCPPKKVKAKPASPSTLPDGRDPWWWD